MKGARAVLFAGAWCQPPAVAVLHERRDIRFQKALKDSAGLLHLEFRPCSAQVNAIAACAGQLMLDLLVASNFLAKMIG